MTQGEWLLVHHTQQESLYHTLRKRLDQLMEDEQQAATDQEAFARRSGGMEQMAEPFASQLQQEARTRAGQILHLQAQLHTLRRQLRQFEAVYAGLGEQEQWMVEQYYLKGQSLEMLANSSLGHGGPYSKSTIYRMKQRLLEKVDRLIHAMESGAGKAVV